jgi:hypothetical protein
VKSILAVLMRKKKIYYHVEWEGCIGNNWELVDHLNIVREKLQFKTLRGPPQFPKRWSIYAWKIDVYHRLYQIPYFKYLNVLQDEDNIVDNSTTVMLIYEEDNDDIEMTEVLANDTPKSKRSGV